jgi:hypothetical protein
MVLALKARVKAVLSPLMLLLDAPAERGLSSIGQVRIKYQASRIREHQAFRHQAGIKKASSIPTTTT